jgi:hypothetical protein
MAPVPELCGIVLLFSAVLRLIKPVLMEHARPKKFRVLPDRHVRPIILYDASTVLVLLIPMIAVCLLVARQILPFAALINLAVARSWTAHHSQPVYLKPQYGALTVHVCLPS